jgi:hypothetical protein
MQCMKRLMLANGWLLLTLIVVLIYDKMIRLNIMSYLKRVHLCNFVITFSVFLKSTNTRAVGLINP